MLLLFGCDFIRPLIRANSAVGEQTTTYGCSVTGSMTVLRECAIFYFAHAAAVARANLFWKARAMAAEAAALPRSE